MLRRLLAVLMMMLLRLLLMLITLSISLRLFAQRQQSFKLVLTIINRSAQTAERSNVIDDAMLSIILKIIVTFQQVPVGLYSRCGAHASGRNVSRCRTHGLSYFGQATAILWTGV